MLSEASSPTYNVPLPVIVEGDDEDDFILTNVKHHDLSVYRACAQEFHETGVVKSHRSGLDVAKKSVHITLILVVIVFCASVATGVTPLTILSVQLTHEIDDLAIKLALQVTEAVVKQLQGLSQPCPALCDAVHQMFQLGLLSSHLEAGLGSPEVQAVYAFLYTTLGTAIGKGIPFLYIGTEYSADLSYELRDGGFLLWNRTNPRLLASTPGGPAQHGQPDETAWWSPAPGQIDVARGMADSATVYDPRGRPWYVDAKAGGIDYKGWTAPYLFFDGVTLGISAVRALSNRTGHFIGVVAADITLAGVVGYLRSDAMRLSPNMHHTVIETSGLIIGSNVPGVVAGRKTAAGDDERVSVADAEQPEELRATVAHLQHGGGIHDINTLGKVVLLDGKYVYATHLHDEYNLDWIYIMYVPTSDFLAHAAATTNLCIGVSVGVMVAILVVALTAAWDLSAHLRLLAMDMRRATSLALDSIRTEESGSRVREIQAISVEFCKLVNALRSFQKYLPQAQVGFLLCSNLEAHLAALQQQVTVMFLDIENFTGQVELLNPTSVIQFYGDIMTLLTLKISDAEGTLDKYIGDAIMAFWNMPRRVAQHEQRAVEAALACRACLPDLQTKGWNVEFRIGINTGCCQVGNFGSRDRLNYTAVGDNVNVASRLEALCKAYNARLLVSGTTHAGLSPDLFLTRLVDKVAVKGKGGVTVIHQVLGWRVDATEALRRRCRLYEEAFARYAEGAYKVAQEMWETAAADGDATAAMMAERLRQGTPEPGGVWRWTAK